jgi:fructokinase
MMIVCCGEALIDFLPRETTGGEIAYQPFNGGSVFNTAVALGRLGQSVGFFSGISTDFFGDSLREGLKASHVDLSYTKIWDRPSTLAFVKLTNGQARYSFFDDNSAGRMLAKKDLPKFAKKVSALHFGSISLIPEPGGATYEALMKRESKTRVISLDPNIRASLINNKAAYLKRINRMIGMTDILKISDEDVAWMTGKTDLKAAAKKWLKLGPKIVVITKGGDGVEIYTQRFGFAQDAVKVVVADTVGAGDTFTAGFLSALQTHKVLTKAKLMVVSQDVLAAAAAFAAKAAAITVSRPGANPPWSHELIPTGV